MGDMAQLSIEVAMQILVAFSFFIAFISAQPLDQERTPEWVPACNGTYLFSEDKKTWNDAYGECELYGSHILQGLTADMYWHSANDNMSEGIWRQYDGGLILWSPWWYDNEPNGSTGSNCAVIGLRTDVY